MFVCQTYTQNLSNVVSPWGAVQRESQQEALCELQQREAAAQAQQEREQQEAHTRLQQQRAAAERLREDLETAQRQLRDTEEQVRRAQNANGTHLRSTNIGTCNWKKHIGTPRGNFKVRNRQVM